MTVTIHKDVMQKSDEWYALRTGILTASTMGKIVSGKSLKFARNETMRAHLCDLLAQRVTKYIEPQYVSFDMMRGEADEIEARDLYERHYAPVQQVGFITNDKWGFTLGYSPDGLVGNNGLIEIKSRAAKYQVETIISQTMPDDYLIQVQTGLLVSEREWCDFISYSAGLPMVTLRIYNSADVQNAILDAAGEFYDMLTQYAETWAAVAENKEARMLPTQRREQEIAA